ncbi:hypothetical protein GF354_04185 [Candidatus Peregrinibacteria bacterium]|nr:hypothetical protein [Candidatus Peregrinibacteria bacterium]
MLGGVGEMMRIPQLNRAQILSFILIGVLVGFINEILSDSSYYDFWKNFYCETANRNPLSQKNKIIKEESSPSKSNLNKEGVKNITSHLLLKRTIISTNVKTGQDNSIVSHYEINHDINKYICQATTVINVINDKTITNKYSFSIKEGDLIDQFANSNILKDLPFCLQVDNISKPPIALFPQYFKYNTWSQLISDLKEKGKLKQSFVDKVELMKKKPNMKIAKNLCLLKGKMNIVLNNDIIKIHTKSDGEIDIAYHINKFKNNKSKDIQMQGYIARMYSIEFNISNPYLITFLDYETIADYKISLSSIPLPHQLVKEKIITVDEF